MERLANSAVSLMKYLGYEASKIAFAVACAFYFGFMPALDKGMKSAFEAGVEEGRKVVDYKSLALKDKPFTNNLCNAWWFEADHKSRRLSPN